MLIITYVVAISSNFLYNQKMKKQNFGFEKDMYWRKTQKRTNKKKSIVIVVAIIAAISVFLIYLFFFSGFKISKATLLDLEMDVPENVSGTNDGFVFLDDNDLCYYDFKGEEIWKLSVDGTLSNLQTSKNAVCLYNDKIIQLFSYDKRQLFATSIDDNIEKVYCGDNAVAVLTIKTNQDGMESSNIDTYDLDGKLVGRIELKNMKILDFGIYGTSDTLWVLSLETTGVIPVSYIATYKLDSTTTGSIKMNTQIVERTFITDDSIIVSGTSTVVSNTYFGEKKADALIYGWTPRDFAVQGTNVFILYETRETALRNEGVSAVKLLNSDLSNMVIYFPEGAIDAFVVPSGIWAFAKNNIYSYTISGQTSKTIASEDPIEGAKKINNSWAIVWSNSTSYLLKLA